MDCIKHQNDQALKNFEKLKKNFFKDLRNVFSGFILANGSVEDYSDHILNMFRVFSFNSEYDLDFEMNINDFNTLNILDFSKKDWMSVYLIFKDVFKYDNKLNSFIYLFFYYLIFAGPFGEDIEALDMSDEMIALMGDEMLKLNNLFDEYFKTHNTDLLNDIVEASKAKSIPSFVVIHLANWINEDIKDKEKFGDLICELYVIALEKIYKKPYIYPDDYLQIDGIRLEVDTSGFSDIQVEYVYSKLRG